ncbi:MAG: hypothetical protein ACI9EW_000124 [Cellvibrionaceae bacterium]|jgi:hypothetical protein
MEKFKKEPLFLALALLGLIYFGGVAIGLLLNGKESAVDLVQVDNAEMSDPELVQRQPEYDLSFVDVAQTVGLDFTHSAFRWGFSGDPIAMMGGGLCWLDYDNNGWIDLYVVNSYALAEAGQWQTEEGGLPTSRLFANENGQFTDVSEASGADMSIRGNGCVAADLNLDGWTDVYVTTSRANLLLINKQDGTFEEVGEASGSYAYGWQTGASVGDMNGDGLPDLFVSGYVDINNQIEGSTMGFPNTHYGLRDLLFINQGNDESGMPIFIEMGERVGLEPAGIDPESDYEYGLGSLMTDVDSDGDLDILVANDTNPNRLYLNESAENEAGFQLIEAGELARINDTNSGMGVASGDFDGDGHVDLFITNLGYQAHSIYKHDGREGVPAYLDVAGNLGVGEIGVGITGWGTIWADFDNDSDLDLLTVNGHVPILGDDEKMPIIFYQNQTAQGEAGQLADFSAETNLASYGEIHGRGAAAADFDNDGDLDVAITQIGGALMLLENRQASTSPRSVTLEFTDKEASGAVITAILPNGQTLMRQVQVGDSYLSSADPRVILGIGDNLTISKLTVAWLDGTVTELSNIHSGETVLIDNN